MTTKHRIVTTATTVYEVWSELDQIWVPQATEVSRSELDVTPRDEPEPAAPYPWPEAPVEKGVWRHEDGTACSTYPDSIDWTFVPTEDPHATFRCPHGTVHCERRPT